MLNPELWHHKPNKVLNTSAQGSSGVLTMKIRQQHSRRTQREYDGTRSEQSQHTLLKCQSGTMPPPPFTELNISLCQNKLEIHRSPPPSSLPWLQCNEHGQWERQRDGWGTGKEAERKEESMKRQISLQESPVTHYKTEYWYWQFLQAYWSSCSNNRSYRS